MSHAQPCVVITGAAGDLGGDLVRSFLADGWAVFGADRAEQTPAEGLIPVKLDVTDRAAMFALAAHAAGASRLQAWINAAGVFSATAVPDASAAEWDRIIAVNLTGTFNGCAAALQAMAPNGGRIVNVGSISGQVGGIGVHPAYGASKAGVHALTKTYALEGARHGVLCNAVAPGLLEGRMSEGLGPRQRERLAQFNPLRRLGQIAEVTRVIRFLADPAGTYMNGTIVPVNGGAYMPS